MCSVLKRVILCKTHVLNGLKTSAVQIKMCVQMMDGAPVRLLAVSGHENRRNDVLYCAPRAPSDAESVVVYFGGDIQDFAENMNSHRDNKNYTDWSLERMAVSLQSDFPRSHVVVVRPSRMEYKTFSCFENFVPTGNCGVPEHVPMHHSLEHLQKLLQNVERGLGELCLILVGFSKGCIVLNQFLYEFHAMHDKNEFVARIKDMFWLDGGHSGGKNTWVTNKQILETLARFEINVHIHVSPYQIDCDRRPWIKKEEKLFYNTLCSLKARVERKVHSGDLPPGIVQHFRILNEFHKQHSELDAT